MNKSASSNYSRNFWSLVKTPPKIVDHVSEKTLPEKSPSTSGVVKSEISFTDMKGVKTEKKIANIRKRKKQVSEFDKNVSYIHNNILKELSLPTIYKDKGYYHNKFFNEIKSLIWLSNKSDISSSILSKFRLYELRKKIRDEEEGFAAGWYLLKIHKYMKSMKNEGSSNFLSQNMTASSSQDYTAFISIASEFMSVPCISVGQICKCGGKYQKQENGIICLKCGIFTESFVKKSTYCDTSRVNSAYRSSYTRDIHFIDAIKNFQGKQNTTISEDVYSIIKKEMEFNSIKIENLKKTHIYQFLSDNGYSHHYEDINLIFFKITGMPCPDLSLYEKELIEYHEKLESAYSEVKDKYSSRISSLNVHFKLYKLLQLLNYPCRKSDFFLLKTQTKYNEHREVWSKICTYNDWHDHDD